jgi:RNA polymerase subunit RPABC4/transcription elongation factor Spt4
MVRWLRTRRALKWGGVAACLYWGVRAIVAWSRFKPVPLPTVWELFFVFGGVIAWLWWPDRRRIRLGHCHKCGYDLTGNVSGVCPECGAAILPATWLWWLQQRRFPSRACRACGYDLTGNVSGRCPECGAPITATTWLWWRERRGKSAS